MFFRNLQSIFRFNRLKETNDENSSISLFTRDLNVCKHTFRRVASASNPGQNFQVVLLESTCRSDSTSQCLRYNYIAPTDRAM